MRWAIAASIVLHIVAVVTLRIRAPRGGAPEEEVRALAVEVVEPRSEAPVPEPLRQGNGGGGGGRGASEEGNRQRPEEHRRVAKGEEKGEGLSMRMRRGEPDPELDVSAVSAARGVEPVAGPPEGRPDLFEAPEAPEERPKMKPRGGGRYRVEDVRFKSVEIADDGRMHIEDHPLVDVGIQKPCPSCVKRDLQAWLKDPTKTVDLRQLLPLPYVRVALMDWIMRKAGQDPYLANKRRLHESTRAQREAMAAEVDEREMRDSLLALPDFLAAIWEHPDYTDVERRRLLFELWDECLEEGRGREARATILAFVRARGIVYPRAELDALNARRASREAFEP